MPKFKAFAMGIPKELEGVNLAHYADELDDAGVLRKM